MSRSHQLRARDLRAAFHLAGECRELGDDWRSWRGHLLRQVNQWLGGPIGYALEVEPGRFLASVEEGMSAELLRAQAEYDGDIERGLKDPVIQRIATFPSVGLTRSLTEFIAAEDLQGRGTISDHHADLGLNDTLFSRIHLQPAGRVQFIAWHRPRGDAVFGPRDVQRLALVQEELQRQLGKGLALANEPVPSDLSPRLRQVLALLLEGEAEKGVAKALGLSQATVHGYIHQIYNHFAVASRAELLTFFLRRARGQGVRIS